MEAQIKKYLRRYKRDLLPTALVIAGIILFLRVIMPQMNEIGTIQSDISTQQSKNENLRQSESTLSSISESQLNSNHELVMNALPRTKSIGSIFESLTSAASTANVEVGSLNVQVGRVYSQSESIVEGSTVQGVPFLNMLVRANGNSPSDLTNFANVLYETAPVLEINTMRVTDNQATYDVNFYYKPINEEGFQAQTVLAPLTPQQQELLSTLENWNQ